MIRLVCAVIICAGAFLLGQTYAMLVREKIQTIADFCALAAHLKSTVRFSSFGVREEMREIGDGAAARFCGQVASSDDFSAALLAYKAAGKEEEACVALIRPPLMLATRSSDAREVADALARAEEDLSGLKRQTEEAYRGILKAAPRAALTVGLFLAVLVI